LVDLFPGSAIFSSRLHDLLQPKSHILIEPDQFYFEPFLKPLLETPGSTYRHVALQGNGAKAQWYGFRKAFNKTIPELEISSPKSDIPTSSKLNNSVLILGNVSRMCKFGGGRGLESPFGLGLLRELSDDALSHSLLNQHGPARMLFWIPERYKHLIVPPSFVYSRSNLNARIETAYDVSEVAGVQTSTELKHARRPDYTERERNAHLKELDRRAVVKRMQQAGLVLPKGREFLNVYRSKSKSKSGIEYRSPLSNTAKTVDALRNQIHQTQERLEELSLWIPGKRVATQTPAIRKACKAAFASITYPQCVGLKQQYQHYRALYVNNERFSILADVALILTNIEAGYTDLKDQKMIDSESDDLRNLIKSLNQTFREMIEGDKTMPALIDDFVEDQLTFYSSTSPSLLERRAYEPLQAQTSDFFPEADMTLMDFVPRGTDLSVPGLADRQECTALLKTLLRNMFALKNQSVPEALDKAIGINAGRDLVRMVPQITDIRKGGRLDPKYLRVRALTPAMIEGLVKAFFEWPFKPENWQLSLARGGLSDEVDSEKDAEARSSEKDVLEED
jgi:transcription factor 1